MSKQERFFSKDLIASLNEDIKNFNQVFPITDDMKITHEGVSRLVMLDRYTFKDIELKTLKIDDFVILTVKEDPKFPARGYGYVQNIDLDLQEVVVKVDDEFLVVLDEEESKTGLVKRSLNQIEKPLELFYEQIAKRNAKGLSKVEKTEEKRKEWFDKFYNELVNLNFIPAGRVIYGAGAEKDVTFFNCYVMPYPQDSRQGISEHRGKVMEIMSRGGGVGTNGSTLRPRNALARGVNGKSSGSVSWLNDIANLTNLVEQGGSRRGAQMIMLVDSHPDIIEFIVSKIQNPRILQFIKNNTDDFQIKRLVEEKLKFTSLSAVEEFTLKNTVNFINQLELRGVKLTEAESNARKYAKEKLEEGGNWSVNNPDFLTGANISVCLTHEFMTALEKDGEYALRFPDLENYSEQEMKDYNEKWHTVGDVREWEKLGYAIKTYRKIKAKELWNLINIAATYSAEPGIFFIDNANDMTNAVSYGQKVVATNPCGEQPLAPYSVCNLAAVNLANFVNKETKEFNFEELKNTVRVGVRMQDNVIDSTPYFLEENTKQALGERRVGLGVMGLHDALIYCEKVYGSKEGNELVDKIFETMAITAYETSIDLSKEKGEFPFLSESPNGRELFINSGYMKKMPEYLREDILKYGIRNSHLLTVAPTGSTGTMVGVSTGLEPYFSFKYYRSGRLGKFIEVNANIAQEWFDKNPGTTELPEWFVSAMELSPEQHADVQCIIQRWVDSSLSKTVNAPKGYIVSQVQEIYERLWKGGAKGGTVYVDGSRDTQVLTLTNEETKFEDNFAEEKQQYIPQAKTEEVVYGVEVGDTCPICRVGKVIDAGGCNTCNNCNTQLKCGL